MITVTRQGLEWVARFPWSVALKDQVKHAGFRFDGTRKLWFTTDATVAARLSPEAAQVANATVAASRAASSTLEIPLSAAVQARGWDFFPYQKAGVQFMLARDDAMVGDEMGLGKTMQAIGLINARPEIRRVLVLCPASLKLNWQRELNLWLARKMSVALANGGGWEADVVIVNYEMVTKYRSQIDEIAWDLLVVDEAHYCKNPAAQRTRQILGYHNRKEGRDVTAIRARRRVFLTGTPILNKPKELWTLVHSLDPNGLGRSWKAFHERYCDGHKTMTGYSRFAKEVWEIDGASNLDELQTRLRQFMVRRLKTEVLPELPPKRRQIIALQAATAETKRALVAEQAFASKLADIAALRAQVEALSVDAASDAYKAAAARLTEAERVAFEETSKVRHETALAKVPQVIEHLTDVLESEAKVIVMAWHHDVVDAIVAGLAAFGVVKADGRDSLAVRDQAVTRFQNEAGVRVIVASIPALGVGVTLTAASTVVFAELDWTPGRVFQAEDRAHRIGQRDSVLIQHVVLDGSMDARMTEMLVEKAGVIDTALDATPAPVAAPVVQAEHPEMEGLRRALLTDPKVKIGAAVQRDYAAERYGIPYDEVVPF